MCGEVGETVESASVSGEIVALSRMVGLRSSLGDCVVDIMMLGAGRRQFWDNVGTCTIWS